MPSIRDAKILPGNKAFNSLVFMKQLLNSDQINDSIALKIIEKELNSLYKVVIAAINTLQNNGRLIYILPRSSERIQVMDLNRRVQPKSRIAGRKYCPGTGSNELLARIELNKLQVGPRDMVICFIPAAEAPYVSSSLKYAKKNGAMTVGISLDKGIQQDLQVNISINLELFEDSTYFRKAFIQKILINTISNAASNYLIDHD